MASKKPDDLEDISPSSSKETSRSNKAKITSRRSNPRVRPYPCEDNLPPISKLSLAKDTCANANCRCNLNKPNQKNTKGSALNYARVCSSSGESSTTRNYIQEAHLKLHHSRKDTRQVIRVARLHLVKNSGTSSDTKTSSGLETVYEKPEEVFGMGSTSEAKDFAALIAEHKEKKSKTLEQKAKKPKRYKKAAGNESSAVHATTTNQSFNGVPFDTYRTPNAGSVTTQCHGEGCDGINLRDLEAGLLELTSEPSACGATSSSSASRVSPCPLHPGRCKRPCTCSDQARLDDLSVDELASYFEDFVYIPRKMSRMAEMMYT